MGLEKITTMMYDERKLRKMAMYVKIKKTRRKYPCELTKHLKEWELEKGTRKGHILLPSPIYALGKTCGVGIRNCLNVSINRFPVATDPI